MMTKSDFAVVQATPYKDGRLWRHGPGVVIVKGNARRVRQYVKSHGGNGAGFFIYRTRQEVGETVCGN